MSKSTKPGYRTLAAAIALAIFLVITVVVGGIFFLRYNSTQRGVAAATPTIGMDALKEVFDSASQGDQAGYRPHFGPLSEADHDRLQVFCTTALKRYGAFLGGTQRRNTARSNIMPAETTYSFNFTFQNAQTTGMITYLDPGDPFAYAARTRPIIAIEIVDPTRGNLKFP